MPNNDTNPRSLMEKFLTARESRGLAPRTLHGYEININVYLEWLAQHPEMSWDQAESVERYMIEQRQKGYKDNTLTGRYKLLRLWFKWLYKRKLIAENPMELVDSPKFAQVMIEYMTLSEYRQLMESIKDDDWVDKRDRCLLYALYWCGLRVAEACDLHIGDLDPAKKTVTVQKGKGGDARFVPCRDEFFALVNDYLSARPETDLEWLFLGSNAVVQARYKERAIPTIRGKFTPEGARLMMYTRCKAAGMRRISPHKARHGIAMELLNSGMDMSGVSKVLGHSNQQTTATFYAKWLTAPLVKAYNEVADRIDSTEGASVSPAAPVIQQTPTPPPRHAMNQVRQPGPEKQRLGFKAQWKGDQWRK